MESTILSRLTTLGHAHRMAVFRLLSRRYPDAVPAGEIAAALGLKANTLSVYLSALMRVELISQTRKGTSLQYRVRWQSVREMMDFLYLDCCRGRPGLCPPTPRPDSNATRKTVLFLCSGNSARSIFAEAILRQMAGDRFEVHSAGTHPALCLNPHTIETLNRNSHDAAGLRPRPVTDFQGEGAPAIDFVITVCDRAANEDCPVWPGQPISAHWGVPDPVAATGDAAERRRAFQRAHDLLHCRIAAFAALPHDTTEAALLQIRIDEISIMETSQ